MKGDAVSLTQWMLQTPPSHSKRRRGADISGSRGSRPALGLCLCSRAGSRGGGCAWAPLVPAQLWRRGWKLPAKTIKCRWTVTVVILQVKVPQSFEALGEGLAPIAALPPATSVLARVW